MIEQSANNEAIKNISGIQSVINKKINILSNNDLNKIHDSSVAILKKTGVIFENSEALTLLQNKGAKVDGNKVRFSEKMVYQAIETAPDKVILHARDPKKNLYLGEGNIHFTSGFGATWVRDYENHQLRDAKLQDLITFTKLADTLKLVHIVLFAVVPQDISPRLLDVICTAEVLQNTTKHVQLSLENSELIDYVIKIARSVVGKNSPLPISAGGVPNSPLHYTDDVCKKFMRLAQENIPCFIVCGAMAGATAPVSLAGMLAQQNAEFLAGVVLHQASNPGAPVVYGTFSGGFDMRYTKLALGGPELSLITCASQQLCDRYGIPMGYATGGITDSPVSDIQTGIEKTFGILSAALSGVDVIHDGVSGLLSAGMTTSLEQMVVDHDICSSIEFFLHGIPVNKNTLAEELIDSIGPGGNFMTSDHTANEFRKSLFISPMRARNLDHVHTFENKSYLLENAYNRAKKLLSDYQPVKVGVDIELEINKIINEASLFINKQKGG